MGIRVLFIYPNTYGMNMLPPAIALFSALLKNAGHQVELFDATYYQTDYGVDSDGTKQEYLNVVPFDMGERGIRMRTTDWRDDLRAQFRRFSPDLVAMSSTEDMWELGLRLLEAIEGELGPGKVPVIAGGVFPTFAPELALRHRLVDMVCVGEGEHALLDLCDRLEHGRAIAGITNLWIKRPDGGIERNPMREPVDINALPPIDIDLFEPARLYRPMAGRVYRMLPVETHRGCPYTCAYCNSPSQNSLYRSATGAKFLRKRRADLIHRELKRFKEDYKLEYVYFWADTFLSWSNEEFEEFCEIYSEFRLPFWIQTRPETLTEDRVRRLAEVGLHRISFGIEHGSNEFRRSMLARHWDNDRIVEALRLPHRYNVQFSVNNIIGFPNETRALAMETVELNRRIEADNYNIYSFVPFHGTPLRRVCEDLGLIHPDTITKCLTAEPALYQPQFPPQEIEGLRRTFVMYVKFPKSRWDDIRRAEADTPEGRRIFEELRQEYMERYFIPPKDNANAEMPGVADLEYGVTG